MFNIDTDQQFRGGLTHIRSRPGQFDDEVGSFCLPLGNDQHPAELLKPCGIEWLHSHLLQQQIGYRSRRGPRLSVVLLPIFNGGQPVKSIRVGPRSSGNFLQHFQRQSWLTTFEVIDPLDVGRFEVVAVLLQNPVQSLLETAFDGRLWKSSVKKIVEQLLCQPQGSRQMVFPKRDIGCKRRVINLELPEHCSIHRGGQLHARCDLLHRRFPRRRWYSTNVLLLSTARVRCRSRR